MMNVRFLLLIGAVALIAGSCKKEFDEPPLRELPVGQILTVAQLRALYQGAPVKFGGDSSFFAVVTADEQNGNLYRNVYVQDQTGAIQLRLLNPGGLYEGDSVRIYLPGTVLSIFSGMMQLDSVDVDNNVVKQATQVFRAPTLVTVSQITPAMQGMLIKLDSVEFSSSELGQTYADPIAQQTQNRTLMDCSGASVIVRTSGYADFAGTTIPSGRGNFTAVVGQFNSDMQLFIRNIDEVRLNGPRCDGGGPGPCTYNVPPVSSVQQDFSDVLLNDVDYVNPSWVNQPTSGTRVWRGRIFQNDKYLRATAFGSNQTNESWFITPPVQLGGGQVSLSFRSATAFWNDAAWPNPLTVKVSNNFDGCDIAGATWTTITGYNAPTQTTANYTFVNSGSINVSSFLPGGTTGNIHVAFIYNGQHPSGATTTLDLDDIIIQQ
jgi:hypothetical protein